MPYSTMVNHAARMLGDSIASAPERSGQGRATGFGALLDDNAPAAPRARKDTGASAKSPLAASTRTVPPDEKPRPERRGAARERPDAPESREPARRTDRPRSTDAGRDADPAPEDVKSSVFPESEAAQSQATPDMAAPPEAAAQAPVPSPEAAKTDMSGGGFGGPVPTGGDIPATQLVTPVESPAVTREAPTADRPAPATAAQAPTSDQVEHAAVVPPMPGGSRIADVGTQSAQSAPVGVAAQPARGTTGAQAASAPPAGSSENRAGPQDSPLQDEALLAANAFSGVLPPRAAESPATGTALPGAAPAEEAAAGGGSEVPVTAVAPKDSRAQVAGPGPRKLDGSAKRADGGVAGERPEEAAPLTRTSADALPAGHEGAPKEPAKDPHAPSAPVPGGSPATPSHAAALAMGDGLIAIAPGAIGAARADAATVNVQPNHGTARDAGDPVPLSAVGVEIAARASEGKHRFEIRLDPPELGRIEVRLDVRHDG